jgi:Tfp pilus assembly protein PilZ
LKQALFIAMTFLSVGVGYSQNTTSTKKLSSGQGLTKYGSRFSMEGLYLESDFQKARVTELDARFWARHNLAETFYALIDLGASLQTGSHESVFSDEFQPRQTFYLNEAIVDWSPFSQGQGFEFDFTLGAISQGRIKNPLLVTTTAFPGLKERMGYRAKNFFLSLEAQQSIANHHKQSNRIGNVDEGTPSFFHERATIGYESKDFFLIEAHLGHFAFANLSSSVANESRFMGNSVNGIQESSQFSFGFQGFESGVSTTFYPVGIWQLSLNARHLFNEKAPDGKNQGLLLSTDSKFDLGEGVFLLNEIMSFRNEADTSPGFYNSKTLGHNNKQGQGASLGLEFTRSQLMIESTYIKAKTIEKSNFQSDSETIVISIGKSL